MNPRPILVVEDDAGLNRLTCRHLERAGYVTLTALTGKAACAQAQANPTALLIIDYGLPDMTGAELIGKLAATGGKNPFIVITGRGDERIAVEMMKLGARDYLVKEPDTVEYLTGTVERVLQAIETEEQLAAAQAALRASEERFSQAFRFGPDAIVISEIDDGRIIEVNESWSRVFEYSREETIGRSSAELSTWTRPDDRRRMVELIRRDGTVAGFEMSIRAKSGAIKAVSISGGFVTFQGKPHLLTAIRDITERKQAQERERLEREVLGLLNRPEGATDTIRDILQSVKKSTGLEAVGIRLREGDDFPYYETNGFPESFVQMERHLCARDAAGEIVRDAQGNPFLECMCGNILCGRINPALPFFTRGGSYWTNSTTDLLASTTEEDRQTRTRDRCNGAGYESVALIPLRSGAETIGLLQLNDHRRNQFTLEMILFLEGLGASIGIALAQRRAIEAVREERDFSRSLLDTAQAIVLVLDNDGQIVSFNPYLEQLSGYRLEEVMGRDWFSTLLPPEDQQHVRKLFSSAIAGTPTRGNVNPILTKDGRRRQIEWYDKTLKDTEGGTIGLLTIGQDVTERKQAEERIARLSTFPELNPNPVLEVDEFGQITYANRAATEGLSRLGLPDDPALFLPKDMPDILGQVCAGRSANLSREVKVGGAVYLEMVHCVQPQRAVRIYASDITAIRQAETALRESEAKYRELSDSLPQPLFEADLAGHLTYANPAAYAMFGYRPEDIARGEFSLMQILAPEEQLRAAANLRRIFAGEERGGIEYQARRRDGSTFPMLVFARAIVRDGKPIGLRGVIIDISERKQAEEQLRIYSEDLALLNRLDNAMNRGEELPAIANLLAAETRRMFGGYGGTLFLLSEDRSCLELVNIGLSEPDVRKVEQLLGTRVPAVRIILEPGNINSTVLEACRPRIMSDPVEIERWMSEMTQSAMVRKLLPAFRRLLNLQSVLLAPLITAGRQVGLLAIVRAESFSDSDLSRFAAIAEQFSVVIGRKLLDDALKASEEKHRQVVENANEAIVVIEDGRIRFANPVSTRILGYPVEEIMDHPFPAFIHPDDRALVAERDRRRLRGEAAPGRYVSRIVRPDGEIRWIEIGAAPTTWLGKPAALSFLTDVTERELAAQQELVQRQGKAFLAGTALDFVQLGEQEDIYRYIAAKLHKLAGEAYVVVNSCDAKSDQFCVRAVEGVGNRTETILKLMGRKPEGTIFALSADEKKEYSSARLKQIKGGLSELSFGKMPKLLVPTLEATFNIADIYAMALFHQGNILGTVNILMRREGALRDPAVVEAFINQSAIALQRKLAQDELVRHQVHLEELVEERTRELKAAQEQLVRREKLAALGQVAGSMAHEIRNPLGVINNAAYFLNMTVGDQLSGRPARHLEIIRREIARANAIITGVLDFAHVRPVERVSCRLQEIVAEAATREELPGSIELKLDIPPRLPRVKVDAGQITQVFQNLLSNARQAMDDQGVIVIRARVVDKSVRIIVADTGPGIAPENLSKVFEPLFSTKTVGVGLGLSVCKSYVEANHGTIEVQSEPGKGATFIMTLPIPEKDKVKG